MAALPSPKRGAAAAMILMVPRVPYPTTCVFSTPHRAPFTARPIANGVVLYRHVAAAGASDAGAEKLLSRLRNDKDKIIRDKWMLAISAADDADRPRSTLLVT